MYHVINGHIGIILEQIPRSHVTEYDYLQKHLKNLDDKEYQRRFKVFWRLNAARLSELFCDHYFNILKDVSSKKTNITDVCKRLHEVKTHKNRQSLQFSFASKLIHMTDTSMPIYDSMIADFYFYAEPNRNKSLKDRIHDLATFHEFLTKEYNRIINNGLLRDAIRAFRDELKPQMFTGHKVIDSLIWAFVSFQKKDVAKGKITYC